METETDLRKLPKSKRPKPTSGQSGAPMALPWDALSKDQKAVVRKLDAGGKAPRAPMTVADLAIGSGEATKSGARQDYLRVRNSLRNLVRGGWVERKERGTYQITVAGRARLGKV